MDNVTPSDSSLTADRAWGTIGSKSNLRHLPERKRVFVQSGLRQRHPDAWRYPATMMTYIDLLPLEYLGKWSAAMIVDVVCVMMTIDDRAINRRIDMDAERRARLETFNP
jgi:hypothetical protein